MRMEFSVRPEVKIFYPTATFGSLIINNQQNMKKHPDIEQAKRLIEKKIRETYPTPKEDPIIQRYAGYFDKWGKKYPIEFQINSIKKGRTFPQVSTHVDCMFMAELENRILTSGHDIDTIQGRPIYDLADEGEEYVKLNGKKQVLLKNDVILKDDEGVLASVLFGPATRTSIKRETVNPLYFAWCPVGIDHGTVDEHLSTITKYSKIVYGEKIESARHII
ncbi:phenylalanine--tRNA ligase beta subunit-related protein [Thermoproteota archaeon]